MWITTSRVLYQAYEDWAFDQTLRGLTPGMRVRDGRDAWLFGGGREKAQAPEVPQAAGAQRSAERMLGLPRHR